MINLSLFYMFLKEYTIYLSSISLYLTAIKTNQSCCTKNHNILTYNTFYQEIHLLIPCETIQVPRSEKAKQLKYSVRTS